MMSLHRLLKLSPGLGAEITANKTAKCVSCGTYSLVGQTSTIETYSGRDGDSAKAKTEAGGWRAGAGGVQSTRSEEGAPGALQHRPGGVRLWERVTWASYFTCVDGSHAELL